MREHDNDRLEQFFRKATSKPDVAFNEEDWKKLEARLDAEEALVPPPTSAGRKFIAATIIAMLAVLSLITWVTSRYEVALVRKTAPTPDNVMERQKEARSSISAEEEEIVTGPGAALKSAEPRNPSGLREQNSINHQQKNPATTAAVSIQEREERAAGNAEAITTSENHAQTPGMHSGGSNHRNSQVRFTTIAPLGEGKALKELSAPVYSTPVRNKQKAMVELPGAEEDDTGVAEPFDANQSTDERKKMALPRLSLLLSFAPDFSTPAMNRYSAPGKAYGAMVHYHFAPRWSVAAGAIKNDKQYTGSGEDYTPPENYWKYATNGKTPISIDGACDVIEFPLIVQFRIYQNRRNRFLLAAGMSSYLMLNESYRYFFAEPNPGAKEGWSSSDHSRFDFNMVNFGLAYERQISPRLSLGIEPYLKIPVADIGWSNLRLFSTGASFNLRYLILNKKAPLPTLRTRGPD